MMITREWQEEGKMSYCSMSVKLQLPKMNQFLESCCKTKCLKNCYVDRSYVEYSYHKNKAKRERENTQGNY